MVPSPWSRVLEPGHTYIHTYTPGDFPKEMSWITVDYTVESAGFEPRILMILILLYFVIAAEDEDEDK